MAMCRGARLALLVYGIIMHNSVYCSPAAAGLLFPGTRPEDEANRKDLNPLPDFYDSNPPDLGSLGYAQRDAYSLYYPREKRNMDHEILKEVYGKMLDQVSTRKYLQQVKANDAGGILSDEENWKPLSKRHSDGIFTDSYSRYLKIMAAKKYLEKVLGKRYRQQKARNRDKGRRITFW